MTTYLKRFFRSLIKHNLLGLMREKYYRLKTYFFYQPFLKQCGRRFIMRSPLFWTPRQISIGDNVVIWPGCRIEAITSYQLQIFNPHIIIGNQVTFQQNCHIIAAGKLTIGANTTISFNVLITDTDHEYQKINENIGCQPLILNSTIIGENCFIGAGAKILAGTILGKQCIVGCNAVVRGVFPDYCVIVGVPAKIVKRYNEQTEKWMPTNETGNFL